MPLGAFPGSSAGKESACSARDPDSIPGLWRSPGEGVGYPLQYSWASLVAQMVKNLPVVPETWVRSLGLFAHKGLYSQCYLYGDALHHSMQIDGKTMESVTDFILGGSIITADGDFSHEIKDACFLEEKLWQT